MLHSVRYLQSQWNARSPELSLKDLVDLLRPASPVAAIERARRHYQACRFQCFVKGVAVAVDGPLPSTGALVLGTADAPDFVVGSVRPCLVLPGEQAGSELDTVSTESVELEVLGALQAGLAVYSKKTPARARLTERLRELAREHRFPVFDVTLQGDVAKDAQRPLALREVVVRLTPNMPAAASGARTHGVH